MKSIPITDIQHTKNVLANLAELPANSRWAVEAAQILGNVAPSEVAKRSDAITAILKTPLLIGRYLRSNPNCLSYDTEILKHFCKLTCSLGYTEVQISEILSVFPDTPVIAHSFTDFERLYRLKQVFSKFDTVEFWTILHRYPIIIKSCPDGLEEKIEKLQVILKIKPAAFRQLITQYPRITRYSLENIAEKMQALRDCTGLKDDELANFLIARARLFSVSVKMMLECREFLQARLVMDEPTAQQFIVRFSPILSLGIDHLKEKVDFLLGPCGLNVRCLQDNPVLLGISLQSRIRPRHFISHKRNEPLTAARLKLSDARFAHLLNITDSEYRVIQTMFHSS